MDNSPLTDTRFCNPLIIAPSGDVDGRYEVWCRICGPERSVYTDSYELAEQLRDSHVYQPKPAPKKDYLDSHNPEYVTDWSESLGHNDALERSPHVGTVVGRETND